MPLPLLLSTLTFADLHFLAVGDWGGLPVPPWVTPAQQRVASAMGTIAERHGSSFVLSLGDHFYFHGVRNADDPRWRRTFERVYQHEALSGAGFWCAVAGNHDHDGTVQAQLDYAARPESRWYYPALQYKWREELPDERGTTVDIVMLDSVLLCGQPKRSRYGQRETTASWRWAEEALLGSTADYLIVASHFPVHSPSSHGPTDCLLRRLKPLLERSHASIYLSGHDHALFHIGAALPHQSLAGSASPPTQFHGVGAGFALSRSARHLHTVPAGQLRFFRRASGKLKKLFEGGFAGVSVSAEGLTVTHYDERGQRLHRHTTVPRSREACEAVPSV